MKRYTLLFFVLFVLFVLLLPACDRVSIQPSTPCVADSEIVSSPNHPKGADAQAIIDKYVAKGIPGVSVLIHDNNGFWIGSGGYADLENQIRMQPCHINKLGSITKLMVGTLVWQLIQDEKLEIDDLISTYIPEVTAKIEHGEAITLAMLLNHSAGVYDIARDLNYNLAVVNDMTKSWTADEVAKFFEGKAATHYPGTAIRYSNSNTLLISMVIEAVTGRQHGELLKERIFDPLGMDHTVYYDYGEDFPFDHLAQGYLDFNNDQGDIQNISNLNPGSGNGFTGVYSTVTDLYRFMHALMVEKRLTTQENLDRIFASSQFAPGNGWKSSIGAIHDEFRASFPPEIHAYGHAGGDIGYSANLTFFPHNNSIFAASYNYGTNLPSAMAEVLRDLRVELALLVGSL